MPNCIGTCLESQLLRLIRMIFSKHNYIYEVKKRKKYFNNNQITTPFSTLGNANIN